MKRVLSILLSLAVCLGLALSLAGCGSQTTSETVTATPELSTVKTTVAEKTTERTLLTQMKISNGSYSYTYTYDYDFDAKTVKVVAKGVPAGDSPTYEAFTWLVPQSALKGEVQEAVPDSTGANEELTLWAQPLVQSGEIDTYRLEVYEEDSAERSGVLTYKFQRNEKEQVSACVVNYDWRTGDDYDAVVKYRYDDNGCLTRVVESSADRDLNWEFTRDADGKVTHSSLQTIIKNEEAIESWLTATNYNYDSEGVLVSISASGEGAQYDSWRTNYLYSETTGTLGALTNQFERVTFTYDETFDYLLKVQTTDLDTGTDYVTIEYTYQ